MREQREKLIEIATDLAKAYDELTKAKMALLVTETDMTRHKLEMAPAAGWPGKNADERKQAQQQAYDQDPHLAQLAKEQAGLQLAIIEANGIIDARVALRRGLEYSINDLYLEMLSGQFDQVILGAAVKEKLELTAPQGHVKPPTWVTEAVSNIPDEPGAETPAPEQPTNGHEWVKENLQPDAKPVAPVHGSAAPEPAEKKVAKTAKPAKEKQEPVQQPKAEGLQRVDQILEELGF